MNWNIGFSRNIILELQNKLGIFHIVLEDKSQKKFTNNYRKTKFTKLAEFGRRLTNISF